MPNKLIQNACGDAHDTVGPEQLASAPEIDAACAGLATMGERAGLPRKGDGSRDPRQVQAPPQQIGRTLAWERFLRRRSDVAAAISPDDAAELVDIDVALGSAEEAAAAAANALTDGVLIADGALKERTDRLYQAVAPRAEESVALKAAIGRLRQLRGKQQQSDKTRAAAGRRHLRGYHAEIAGNQKRSQDLKVREALTRTSIPSPDKGGPNHGKH